MTLKPVIVLIPIALGLAGCGTSQSDDQARLALACETVRCECQQIRNTFSLSPDHPAPVQWRPDGSAYCPEGTRLSRVP